MLGRGIPQHLAVKISEDSIWVRGKTAGVPSIPFKGPHAWTHSLKDLLTLSSSTRIVAQKQHMGKILSGFRARTGGAALARAEVLLGSDHVPC